MHQKCLKLKLDIWLEVGPGVRPERLVRKYFLYWACPITKELNTYKRRQAIEQSSNLFSFLSGYNKKRFLLEGNQHDIQYIFYLLSRSELFFCICRKKKSAEWINLFRLLAYQMACHTLTFRYVFVDAITRSQTYVNTGGEGGMSSSPPSPRKKWENVWYQTIKKVSSHLRRQLEMLQALKSCERSICSRNF